MLYVMQTPRECLHTGESAFLLNILQGETLKTALLACDGTVRMDKPTCWQKGISNYSKETVSSFTVKTEIDK